MGVMEESWLLSSLQLPLSFTLGFPPSRSKDLVDAAIPSSMTLSTFCTFFESEEIQTEKIGAGNNDKLFRVHAIYRTKDQIF